MAALKIEEIHTQSSAGWTVVLTGLDPTDSDFILGTINTPGQGVISGKWDEAGILRNGTPNGNINPTEAEIADLIALGKHLGAP
jgi:hypothetical protein